MSACEIFWLPALLVTNYLYADKMCNIVLIGLPTNPIKWNVCQITPSNIIPTLLITDSYGYKLEGIFLAFTLWIIARGIPLIIKFYKTCVPLVQKM